MKRAFISITLVLATLAPCIGTARATPITIGSPLTGFGPILSSICPPTTTCSSAQRALPGATLTSPVDGVIVRWHLLGGNNKNYSVQVLSLVRDGIEPEYKSLRASPTVKPAGTGVETFATAIPIAAGQVVALHMEPGASTARKETSGARELNFSPALVDGGAAEEGHIGNFDTELGFNAVVQPPPTLAAITPAKGPLAGGNKVTMDGTEFADVKEVKFGTVPARSFSVDSEGKISAVPPAVPAATKVQVSVTTVAGTAALPGAYTYEKTAQESGEEQKRREEEQKRRDEEQRKREEAEEAKKCHVPRLRGKKLTTARKLLRKAHCAPGRVRKKRGAKVRTGKVVVQRPKAGKVLPSGTKVNLTLGRR